MAVWLPFIVSLWFNFHLCKTLQGSKSAQTKMSFALSWRSCCFIQPYIWPHKSYILGGCFSVNVLANKRALYEDKATSFSKSILGLVVPLPTFLYVDWYQIFDCLLFKEAGRLVLVILALCVASIVCIMAILLQPLSLQSLCVYCGFL